MTVEEAALEWITRRRVMMPPDLRPSPTDITAFSRICYSELLTGTEYPDVPVAGCRCEWCRALRRRAVTNFAPMKDTRAAARAMEERWLVELAAGDGIALDATQVRSLARDPMWMADVAVCAYGEELVRRLEVWSRDIVIKELSRRFASGAGRRPVLPMTPEVEDVLAARKGLRGVIRTISRSA